MKRFVFSLLFTILLLAGCTISQSTEMPTATKEPSPSMTATQTTVPITPATANITSKPQEVMDKTEKGQKTVPKTEQTDALETPSPTDKPTAESKKETVTLSIKTDDGSFIFSPVNVPFTAGESVLDILVRVCKEKNIPVVYSGRKKNGYVEGINSLFEFDKGAQSGWVYRVNETKPSISSGAYVPKSNDIITWEYVLSSN